MAISKNGLTIFALLVTLITLGTENIIEFSSPALPVHYDEEHFLPHTRQKRNVLTDEWNYILDVVVNASSAQTFEQIRFALNATSLPIQLDNNTEITDVVVTTVCSPTGSGFQCRCEEQFAWPYSSCVLYTACDSISSGICKCINAIPTNGQSCQPISELLSEVEYAVDVELNVTDVETINYLRSILSNGSYSLALGPIVNVTDIDITTVCYPNDTNFQCRCEDQHVWSYRNCITYGACDKITDNTCRCINGIPSDGQYCQPKEEAVQLYEYVIEVEIRISDIALIEQLRDNLENISFPVKVSNTINITQIDIIFTVPPVVYEYDIFIEVNTTDPDQLRNTLDIHPFPIQVSSQINISAADITTVCSKDGSEFQCRCEEDYLWPCDKCATHGKCDGDTNNSCACIKAIPTDGQYCQSIHQQNFSVCPLTTTSPSTAPPVLYEDIISVELNISDLAVINQLRSILSNISYPISISNQVQISDVNISTVCSPSSGSFQCRCEDQYRWPCDQCFLYGPCDNITGDTCGCINAIPPDGQYCQSAHQYNFTACPLTTTPSPTTPPILYEYLISIELNISDVAVIDQLRSILSNISYPISISNQLQISDINISTVCSPSSGGFQCRCEDQYRWPCDQCSLYGPCDNISGDTCGCINAIPPDGQYCQSAHQYNFTACPQTTPSPPSTTPLVLYEDIISVELNISDVAVINQLRSILSNISYPISISNQVQISEVNVSTVCSPSSGSFQCRCEDQYRWPCGQCFLYGPCDNITGDTCGCINAIPPDGQYCQSAHQYNFTACPLTTTPSPTTPLVFYEYLISIELNISDVAVINQLRSILSNISYPISISNQLQISDINISTVCSLSSGSFQCRCEDQYRWPCDQCSLYGPCDNISGDTCGCINAIPPDGQYCQSAHQYNFTACPQTTPSPPSTTPPVLYEDIISVELNISDVAVINQLRSILSNISYPISISNQVQISEVNVSTVCSPSSGSFQCRCEDQYRWPCDQCFLYGPCDNITGDTCGCINAIPPDGQYCQSAHQYNFTACPLTTTPSPTTPPVLYEYLISIELNISDVAVINQLRSILSNISYPIGISNQVQISDVNISTVCSPSSGSFQCRCEDQYRWPCDQCFLYGPCDNITGDTCGCINAIPPDGQYCQSAHQYNFTACPLTTTPSPTTPPVLYEYLISIELNSSDVAVINQLRSILSNISYPIGISNQVQISDVNISTVCSPSSGSFQCRCEDQYRWPCDQCFLYGPCDNITGDTCGCINAIPPDGQYCQSAHQYNFTACPLTTTPSPTTPPVLYEYLISIELNISDVAVIHQLRSILSNISYPIGISNQVQISDVNISTVCSPSSGSFQCRCEDQYRWPCDQCFLYGPCDNITGDTCGCINAIPPDGQYCQSAHQYNFTACPLTTTPSPTTPPVLYEYLISIELNISDVAVIHQLRSILSNISYPIGISNQVQISDVNISTVCSPSSGSFQCRCEDQYRWPCDQCFLYGPCDNITGDTCGCINAIPPDGQYCQSAHQYNFTACPLTTTPSPTTPPVLYEYLISIELNISDVAVINQLRSILSNISYPIGISNQVQISDVNISTVCSPSSGSFQCRCEDQYRWPCDQCFLYGPCDNITGDTCGCINAIPPDGQYCQSAHQYNFTACPLTTTPSPTTPPVLYEYLISIELNISDVAVINQLRSILSNISYPIGISNQVQISDVNISTVCSPSSGSFQCRCEDQYRWPCDQCFLYGPCDNITGDTCGCINAIPPDGQYCQSAHQYNFTACPLTTTPSPTTPPVLYEYLISIELNSSDVAVINQLRSILSNISYPISISNQVQISDVNISTVCSPSSGSFQCRCEDQYRWPCDQCFLYGPCDNITGDTCGCINAIPPDGQYCKSAHQYNFTACPLTTTPSPTTPPVLYEYLISIELNISDVAVINQLRRILSNISYPIRISNQVQISDVNISTVCSPSSGSFQCRCEDQYRWPCDQCFLYGPCDNITGDTCGCINAIPPDGQYCKSAHQYNFTACPLTTTPSPTSPPVLYEYLISIELNISDVAVINQLRRILSNISYPIRISNQVQISDVNISTVCSPSSGGFQCRCEDQYRWPCDQCFLYGPCDNITGDTCGCINAIPPVGQYCQSAHQYNFTACPLTTTPSPTTPPVLYEYLISIELNISDVAVINQLRSILSNISYPIRISNQVQISDVNISTVCSLSSGGFQCRCEDQYRWPCDQCFLYGPCDNITGDTCGCINAIPPVGQYCQSAHQYNFTACPLTTTPSPTTPPVLYEYLISIELNSSDVAVINQLRSILSNISYPISISNQVQISDVNISTVCSPSSGSFQCRCEDQYRWPCDQCFLYGPCDNITVDTCGCINAIPPDGQYCKSAHQYNFTACPLTTTPSPTSPPVLYEYLISIELNISDVAVINQLRRILSNISYPIRISNQVQISDVNISTVCSPSSGGFQCRCEDQYRWPCDQCFLYGPCDNITGDTCGCINAIPPVGQYCQSAHQYNFTACPLTTTPSPTTPPVLYEYLISIELNISDVAVINQLRSILSNISYPIRISNQVQISDVNISTVCSLSSGGFQCRCEDQYRWPCDQCFLYGPCDNITGDTCGCINAIPPVGQYCQSAHQYNFTACPLTTTPSPTTPPVLYEYLISIELNISDVAVINQLRSILSNISYPIRISNQVQISDVNISTVCSLSSGGFQCRCEDQYRWPCDQCFLYGPCDNITGDTCGCINAIPPVGQYCQSAHQYNFTACPLTTTPSPTTPPVLYEYLIFIELNISDVVVINQLRSILSNISYPIGISNQVQISDVNISTVCSPSSGSFQCRCEDQYRWPCDQCFLYGPCDNIADDTCGCINAIPPDGQYCQSAHEYNFTACPQTPTSPPSTTPPPTTTSPPSTTPPPTTTSPPPTTPLVLYEYLISIELNISDVAVINKLRSILSNISYPISISNQLQISDVNISTVCSPSSGDFQCRCEDLYRWPCDQCFRYGPCDNITGDTCGCINAIPPDGQYCQSAHQYNFTACPQTTPSPPSTTPPPTTTSPPPTTPPPTTTSPPPTTPLVLYEYLISIELNISDVAVINQLRSILSNISYPISISNQLQISDVNISTVCSPSSGGFQCRCEDQYRWPCDQCFRYGPCDNINGDTCGCINAIPPDGQYCQSAHQYNFTACPQTPTSPPSTTSPPTTTSPPPTTPPPTTTSPPPTTPPPTTTSPPPTTPLVLYEYLISIELNISDVAVINQLRSILSNISYPISISNQLQISDVNISTVCSPSSGGFQCRCEDQYRWPCDQCFRYGPCDNINGDTCDCINAIPPDGQYCQSAHQYNFTACPLTTPSPTNSTPIATTPVNTTTPTIPPTNSTTPPPPPTTTTTPPPTTTPTPTPTANSTPIATTPVNTTTPTMPPTNSTTPPLTPPPPTTTTTTTTTPPTPPPTTTNNTTTTNNNNNNNNNNNTTTNNTTTTTTTPPPPTMVTSIPAPTTALTTTTKATTTTTITTTTTVVTGFDVQMSVTLDKEYTDALSNPESDTYKNLKSSIETVLEEQYKGMTGFLSVFVKAFRQGSVITDFVVQTTQVITDEFAKANQDLPEAMKPIAPVFGPVTAVYNSPTPISPPPDILYTGNTMRLTCDEPPESLAMGTISVSRWKFNGREIKNNRRIKITISGKKSLLTIQNVVLADIGNYECTLEGQVITFSQKGRVLEAKIKQAPNVQIQSKVNVKCQEVKEQPLDCCVQSPYTVKWYRGLTVLPTEQIPQPGSYCIRHKYKISCDELLTITFECKVDEPTGYMMTTAMTIFRDPIECDDNQYGAGRQGDTSTIGCGKGQEGSKTAVCEERKWKLTEDTCILTQIKDLVIVSQDLEKEQVPEFVGNLSRTVLEEKTEVSESSATISAIVGILNTIANVSTTVDKPVMEDVLQTVDVIIGDDARESWATLNSNGTRNASSELLGSLETLSNGLVGEFVIETERILLNRTRFNNSFMANLNSSIILDIPDTDITNTSITTITFSTLNNVMPVRNTSFNMSLFNANSSETVSDNTINAAVVLIRINATIQNVTLTYNKRNKSLSLNPQCVFWNFTLFDNLGAWDDEGCEFVSDVNNTVTCNCNHLTSFSILMATDIPPELKDVLDIITYVGVGISLASLVICLIIEGYVWKAITRNSTAFMRHVSIINTALSLLIADICFIIAASVAKNSLENPGEDYNVPVGPCSTATFFMHFFYLALFFWMLVSGLLLFYRTVMVFSHMSKSTMLAIGFSLGYGGPLIIAVITVAVTAPGKGYIRKDYACWLNWMETKALLAMVIPALIIVFINILIVIVVLFKMLRRGVGDAAQTDEKHTLWVIVRCVVILTPLFGLTWSLGVGTMVSSTNKGLHIAFAFFNSLQGFFILVFGTLFDSKIRALLSKKLPGPTSSTGSNPTRSTSGGVSSLSGLNLISRLRGRRYIYRVSEATNSSSNGASESFMNI
ncbi:uncharacterized protein LOC127367939 isoform X8 [Dicentrarchus labrax]|uniref:uncharacterized protein LOC127367939 isoform X7 n=1 Tax=Dicentrarchus labrax TaxID=13489 RepID=UPI0021F5D2A9|nr:uncharacterized protein LOC127367939 isoform X7 [Dicentrarchus labrax]XP_051264163.1 uncharacterized protein LOC127367939 isoform X8 [Dicentrarchus labrax]